MDSIIDTFHVDLKLLLAQAVNFAIVFAVLYYLAFKPLAKTMTSRSQQIADGLKNAEAAKQQLADSQAEQTRMLQQTKQEAHQILEQARLQAEERKTQMVEKAKQEIGQIIMTEKTKIQQEKIAMMQELKQEVADLVILTTDKFLQEKIDKPQDKNLINKLIK